VSNGKHDQVIWDSILSRIYSIRNILTERQATKYKTRQV